MTDAHKIAAHEITRADKVAAEGWAREQSPGLQMMLVKPRGLHEAFAAHRIAHEAPLLAENERLRARLEVVTGWSESADGISCRDDTIALQDARIEKLLARIAELEGVLSALMSRQSAYAYMFGRAINAFGMFAGLLKSPHARMDKMARLMEAAQEQAQADADTIAQQEEWLTARAALKQEPGI